MPHVNLRPMDNNSMYEVREYTDEKVGTVFEKTPVQFSVKLAGPELITDIVRSTVYSGQCFIQNQPFTFPIEATTLLEAVENFHTSIAKALEKLESEALQQRIAQPGKPNGLVIDQPRRK